jgi:hypothetical protein
MQVLKEDESLFKFNMSFFHVHSKRNSYWKNYSSQTEFLSVHFSEPKLINKRVVYHEHIHTSCLIQLWRCKCQLKSQRGIQNHETPPAIAVFLFQLIETFIPSKP